MFSSRSTKKNYNNRGLGHIALQWAAAMGCREIVAISGRDSKKEEAFKLGATKFIKYVYLCIVFFCLLHASDKTHDSPPLLPLSYIPVS